MATTAFSETVRITVMSASVITSAALSASIVTVVLLTAKILAKSEVQLTSAAIYTKIITTAVTRLAESTVQMTAARKKGYKMILMTAGTYSDTTEIESMLVGNGNYSTFKNLGNFDFNSAAVYN